MAQIKRTYKIQPFDVSLTVYFTDTPIDLANKLAKDNPDPAFEFILDWGDGGAAASTNAGYSGKTQDTYKIYCIFDLTDDNGSGWEALFAHEAVHVVSNLYLYSGTKPDLENDEPMAYLVDYIVRLFVKTKEKIKNEEKIKICSCNEGTSSCTIPDCS